MKAADLRSHVTTADRRACGVMGCKLVWEWLDVDGQWVWCEHHHQLHVANELAEQACRAAIHALGPQLDPYPQKNCPHCKVGVPIRERGGAVSCGRCLKPIEWDEPADWRSP